MDERYLRLHVYDTTIVDDPEMMIPVEFATRSQRQSLPCNLETAKIALRKGGWEGDGILRFLYIPPFVFGEDPYGDCVYFVKQQNNGTGWILSHHALDYLPGVGVLGHDVVSVLPVSDEESDIMEDNQ